MFLADNFWLDETRRRETLVGDQCFEQLIKMDLEWGLWRKLASNFRAEFFGYCKKAQKNKGSSGKYLPGKQRYPLPLLHNDKTARNTRRWKVTDQSCNRCLKHGCNSNFGASNLAKLAREGRRNFPETKLKKPRNHEIFMRQLPVRLSSPRFSFTFGVPQTRGIPVDWPRPNYAKFFVSLDPRTAEQLNCDSTLDS